MLARFQDANCASLGPELAIGVIKGGLSGLELGLELGLGLVRRMLAGGGSWRRSKPKGSIAVE